MPSPVTIGGDPLPAVWRRRREGEIEYRQSLSLRSASTDGDDLVGVIQIDPFDLDRHAQQRRGKRHCEMFLQHAQKSHELFGIPVGIDGRLFDELVESCARQRRQAPVSGPSTRAVCHARAAAYAAAC